MSYRLYILIIYLVAFSYYTGPVHPYMGLPRHMWLAFPIFLGIGPRVQKSWKRIGAVAIGMLLMGTLLIQYVLESWVP
jgi:hypothetical protein